MQFESRPCCEHHVKKGEKLERVRDKKRRKNVQRGLTNIVS